MATEFEITARWKKATAFAAHLDAYAIRSWEIEKIQPSQWRQMATVCAQRPPSEATIALVYIILRAFEGVRVEAAKEQQTA